MFDITHLAETNTSALCVFVEHQTGETIHYQSMALAISNTVSGAMQTVASNSTPRRLNARREECSIDETLPIPPREPADRLIITLDLQIPEQPHRVWLNPLTDGTNQPPIATHTNIAGRVLVRPVQILEEMEY